MLRARAPLTRRSLIPGLPAWWDSGVGIRGSNSLLFGPEDAGGRDRPRDQGPGNSPTPTELLARFRLVSQGALSVVPGVLDSVARVHSAYFNDCAFMELASWGARSARLGGRGLGVAEAGAAAVRRPALQAVSGKLEVASTAKTAKTAKGAVVA